MSITVYPKSEFNYLRIDPPVTVGDYLIVLYDIVNTIELEIVMYTSPGYDFIETDDSYLVFKP